MHPTDEAIEKPSSFFQTKAFAILMVLLASLAGYLLAPGDLASGTYQNRIEITADGSVYSIDIPFEMGTDSSPVQTYQETSGDGTIEVQASPGYRNALGQKIAFKARLLDADGNPVHCHWKMPPPHFPTESTSRFFLPLSATATG